MSLPVPIKLTPSFIDSQRRTGRFSPETVTEEQTKPITLNWNDIEDVKSLPQGGCRLTFKNAGEAFAFYPNARPPFKRNDDHRPPMTVKESQDEIHTIVNEALRQVSCPSPK